MDTAQNNKALLDEIRDYLMIEEDLLEGDTLKEILDLIDKCETAPTEENMAELMNRLTGLGVMNDQLANMYEKVEQETATAAQETLEELEKLGKEVDSISKEMETTEAVPATPPAQMPTEQPTTTVDTTVLPVQQTIPTVG